MPITIGRRPQTRIVTSQGLQLLTRGRFRVLRHFRIFQRTPTTGYHTDLIAHTAPFNMKRVGRTILFRIQQRRRVGRAALPFNPRNQGTTSQHQTFTVNNGRSRVTKPLNRRRTLTVKRGYRNPQVFRTFNSYDSLGNTLLTFRFLDKHHRGEHYNNSRYTNTRNNRGNFARRSQFLLSFR